MEAVLEAENMRAAYLAVKANRGAPGVDGMSVGEMKEHLQKHWSDLAGKLRAGGYRPAAVRAVEIPKASGGQRRLGIPTVIDRMIQQAISQTIGPVFEADFSESSYGFRPGRSAHDAVRAAQGYVAAGKSWVVDIDLKMLPAFKNGKSGGLSRCARLFDQVNHDRLMTMVGRKVRDKRLLRLIGDYLRAPWQREDRSRQPRTAGTPQGGPLESAAGQYLSGPVGQGVGETRSRFRALCR